MIQYQRLLTPAFLILLVACGGAPNLPAVTQTPIPSLVPHIVTPTPVIIYPTPTALTSTPPAEPTSSSTPTFTATTAPQLTVGITGCNTSIDVSHQMGEVTNAFALVRNPGGIDLTNVCATLYASDEARQHPDKTHCVASLPMGFQVLLKLTVDTGFKLDTSIWVDIVSEEGLTATDTKDSCRDIGMPGINPGDVGVIMPIP